MRLFIIWLSLCSENYVFSRGLLAQREPLRPLLRRQSRRGLVGVVARKLGVDVGMDLERGTGGIGILNHVGKACKAKFRRILEGACAFYIGTLHFLKFICARERMFKAAVAVQANLHL